MEKTQLERAKFTNVISYHYGFSDFTFNMMMSIVSTYFAVFLTNVAMISAAAMGTMLLVARIGDALTNLMSGAIIAKYQMKWGKFRSWLLIAPPFTAIFMVLMFTNFNLDPGMKALLLGIFYVIACAFVNFAYNAHMALISVIGSTSEERLKLAAKKGQFLTLSTIVFGLAFVPILTGVAGQYNIAIGIFAILQIFGYWNLFRVTKDFDRYSSNMHKLEERAGIKLSSSDMFASLFQNPQLLILMCSDILRWIGFMSVLGLIAYYFIYVAGNIALTGTYFFWHGITSFIGSLIAVKIAQIFGKKITYMLSSAIIAGAYLLIYLFAGSNATTFIILACIGVLGFQLAQNVQPVMYNDCAEFYYNKSGKDTTGFTMSMFAMSIKIGVAISGAAMGWGLAAINFSPNVEVTPIFTSNLITLITMLPVVFIGLSIILMISYKLNDKRVSELMDDNAKKRAQIKSIA